MKRVVVIVVLAAMALQAFAQAPVKGRAVEAGSGVPEVGAVVMAGSGTYAVADSAGVFTLKLAPGDYELTVSSMGRKDYTRSISVPAEGLDLGDIALETDSQMLKGATVTDLKTLVKMDADKVTYDVEGDADAKANTLLDMLRKVPMVTVDAQDNITVNGSSDFKIYVDGKPDQMLSSNPSKTLKNIPASSIKNIEVITNPGAKYDAEGTGGVLNLITDRSSGKSALPDGVNGTVSSSVDTRGGVNGGLNLNARKGKFTFGTNIYAGYMRHPHAHVNFDRTEDNGYKMIQRTDVGNKVPFVWGSASMSYDIDTLNLLSAQLGVDSFGNRNDVEGSICYIKPDGTEEYSYNVDSYNTWQSTGFKASVDWQHLWANNKDRYFILSYRYSGDPNTDESTLDFRDYAGNINPIDPYSFKQNDRTDEHTLQADFTTPLGKSQELNLGAKYIFRHNKADDKYYSNGVYDPAQSVLYNHYNNIAAAYAEYKATVGKFTGKAGFRYEYTWQKVDFDRTPEKNFNARFGSPVPNISLQYNISEIQNLAFTWNMRIRRPGIAVLNPFVIETPFSKEYGNTDITPANTHRMELKYNFFSPKVMVSARGTYNFCNDGINEYSFFDAGDGLLHTTYGNILKMHDTGAGIFANWNASKKTRVYANFSGGYKTMEAAKENLKNSGWHARSYFGFQQTLPWDVRLTSGLFWSFKDYELQGWNRGCPFFNIGVSKSFFEDKLSISLMGMTNVSKGNAEFKNYSEGRGYTNMNVTSVPIRSIRFEISWSFGRQGISVKRANKTITNDDVEAGSRSGGIGGGVSDTTKQE